MLSIYAKQTAAPIALPVLMGEFVQRHVALIVAGSPLDARTAKAATSTIPIVFSIGEDPIKEGIVTSFNRPGGNITGVANILATNLSRSDWSCCASSSLARACLLCSSIPNKSKCRARHKRSPRRCGFIGYRAPHFKGRQRRRVRTVFDGRLCGATWSAAGWRR